MVEDPKDEKVPEPDKPDPDLMSPLEEGERPSEEADPGLRSDMPFAEDPETPDQPNPDQPDPDLNSTEERAPQNLIDRPDPNLQSPFTKRETRENNKSS